MGSKFSVRGKQKPVFKKAKAEAGAGAFSDNDDSMTLMDMIRTFKRPTHRQQQRKRPAELVADGEENEHDVITPRTDFSSGSDDDLGGVVCQHKRKRKCRDLNDILKCDPPVASRLTIGRPQDENSLPSKAKKSKPAHENSHDANAGRNGRRKAESSPDSVIVANFKAIHGNLEHRPGFPVGHQTNDMREMMKSFPDSLGLYKPVAVTDGPALEVGKRQRFQAGSPNSKAGCKVRPSSQTQLFRTSDSQADDCLPVSSSSLHTCSDAKNCQNACVATAVAPILDHMSEEELIYWYEEVTGNKFTSRNGEKVRGRIRRVIRAEVKRAAALNSRSNSHSNISTCDEAEKCDSSTLEPRTPSPGKLLFIDLYLQNSPSAFEFPVSIGSKEDMSCAFNSAASFDDFVGEEGAGTSQNFSEVRSGNVPLEKSELLDCGEGLAIQCEPLEMAVVIEEQSVLDGVEAKSVPASFTLDVNYGPDKLESECGEAPSPSGEKRTLTGERCGEIFNGSRTDSLEGESLLPSADSALGDTASRGIVVSHSLTVELKVREGPGPILNASPTEETGTTSLQPSCDSTRESIDFALNLDAAEMSQPVVNEDITAPIIRQECTVGEEDVRDRSEEEKRVPEMGLDGSLFSRAGQLALCTPNLRPCSSSREHRSSVSQLGTPLQACGTGMSAGHRDLDHSSEINLPDVHALQVAEELKPNSDDFVMLIEGSDNLAAQAGECDKKGKESVTEDSSQCEISAVGLIDSQRTAPVLGDLRDLISEPAEGIAIELETSKPAVDVCSISESQQSADRLNKLALDHTSSQSWHVEVSMQDESRQSCAVVEHNTVETLAEVCEHPLANRSQRPVNSHAMSDASRSMGHDESVNDTDGPAEPCGAANIVRRIDGEDLPICQSSTLHSEIPEAEMGVGNTENISTLLSSLAGNETENRVLSLEEYIAVHQGEDTASPDDLVEDVTTHDLEDGAAPQLTETQGVSVQSQGDATKDEWVNEFATQQMLMEVVCSQQSDIGIDHLEEVPSPNGTDLDEDVAVLKMKDIGIDEVICTQQVAGNITSHQVQEVLSQVAEECGIQKQAEGSIAPPEVESAPSQGLEGDGTAQIKEEEGSSRHNPEDFDEGAVSLDNVEENSMEDELVPTALSKAVIEKNGERSGAVDTLSSLAHWQGPLLGQRLNAKEKPKRVIAREKRRMSLENSPESNCDSATIAQSTGCIDLLACEKLGEESSQDFEPPSKLPCRRKTISPLSQLELIRASSSDSPPSDDSQIQKIAPFRLKLPTGLASLQGGSSPPECERTPGCNFLEPNDETGKDEVGNGLVVSLDSSEDDTDDSCSRQELGSRGSEGKPAKEFSLCLSPSSPSPESGRTDPSPNISSQEPRDSQSISAPSSKGILKTGPQACKGLCKCDACSTSRSKAGTAADFIASQMKTFQVIAGHLTKEMQGLRTIIEANLPCPGETGKIQETLKKSRDVEEATAKNLNMLLRDCKRYSKLTATKPIPMRKIVFADEAGKKLCHVKTFQSQSLPKSI